MLGAMNAAQEALKKRENEKLKTARDWMELATRLDRS